MMKFRISFSMMTRKCETRAANLLADCLGRVYKALLKEFSVFKTFFKIQPKEEKMI